MARTPIVQERVFDAAPEDVFAAWSEPDRLSDWMRPGPDMKEADVEIDFRVGGSFRIVMHGAEQDFVHHGEYLEIDRPRRLVLSWVSEWMPPGEEETRVTVELAPVDGGRTHLRLTHDRLPESNVYAGHRDGWQRILLLAGESLA